VLGCAALQHIRLVQQQLDMVDAAALRKAQVRSAEDSHSLLPRLLCSRSAPPTPSLAPAPLASAPSCRPLNAPVPLNMVHYETAEAGYIDIYRAL
jgi:hypothetical protein